MREILYRGKSIKTGKWEVGHLTSFYDYLAQIRPLTFMVEHRVHPETVGGYTGLKDRDGRRIFEGDIVKDQFGNIGAVICSQHFLDWRIRFYTGRDDLTAAKEWGVRMFDWVYPKMCLEIIGNVHDNPELLKDAP